jgi:hypothetical protein
MKKFIFLFVISSLVFNFSNLLSQNTNIRLTDPQNFRSSKATIDSLTIAVKPLGAYSQISYIINISTQNTIFNKIKDTVEIESFFNLPEQVIVNDSWLWVEDTLVYADLIDRWTANMIYEGIVHRARRDPSIFYKNSPTAYEFRLFPLAGTKYRKFLISFLVPNEVKADQIKIDIPTMYFSTAQMPDSVNLVFIEDPNYSAPKFLKSDGSVQELKSENNQFFDKHYISKTSKSNFLTQHNMFYTANKKNDFQISTFNSGNEKFYTLTGDFKNQLEQRKSVKQLYIIEYVPEKTSIKPEALLTSLADNINANFISGDSLNIAYINSNGVLAYLYPDWKGYEPDNSLTIASEIKSISTKIAKFTMLPYLLTQAVKFINENETGGSIVAIASSDIFGSTSIANPIIEQYLLESKFKIPFYSIDFCTDYYVKKYYINNTYYIGNNYLYSILASQTGGQVIDNANIATNLNKVINSLYNISLVMMSNLNLYISTDDGFTYQIYEPNNNTEPTSTKLFQVGKYVGSDNFNLRITYMIDNQPFIKELKISSTDIIKSNYAIPQIWVGNHLKALEKAVQTNSVSKNIIDLSIKYRVLSKNTAFLALEPWMRDSIFKDDDDKDMDLTDVKNELINNEILINTFPNPATIDCKISINSTLLNSIESINIYNSQGKIIRKLSINLAASGNETQILWDLVDENGSQVPSGIYYIIISDGIKTYTHKISVIR